MTAGGTRMRAVVKSGTSVTVSHVPLPVPAPQEVLIGIEVAGVCRTDIYAARGLLACADPLILGHEFAGWSPGAARRCTGSPRGTGSP